MLEDGDEVFPFGAVWAGRGVVVFDDELLRILLSAAHRDAETRLRIIKRLLLEGSH